MGVFCEAGNTILLSSAKRIFVLKIILFRCGRYNATFGTEGALMRGIERRVARGRDEDEVGFGFIFLSGEELIRFC